ncbi:MAG: carbamoyl-phosphate synthase (glutamine-hydrolyzing) large subunit [bacterium]|nr:carbamoyl-phosphate synthase (glutamine-hydrolyzing) large subunit [bacterium]
MKNKQKILLLGSGALKIGEAGEFDYSGSQAIKALREEGIETILVNPNIATIQTSKGLAHRVYFLPVMPHFVEKIIEREKPDGILLGFGGQTALNCGLALYKQGILRRHHVKVFGTPIEAIRLTEDRKAFADHVRSIGIPTPQSETASSIEGVKEVAHRLGFPVMIRAGFSLGGQGSGIARTNEELSAIAEKAFAFGPQILVEQYLHHYKEVEYEVVRDSADNCITVCNMENMDPLGIHTGESIVVAPSQTLTNAEYHTLRAVSIKIVRSLGIVGECNVQFAVHPKKFSFFVIEINARLSRSSALASKATGYPLAYVAAKLALGKRLPKIPNAVTKTTQSCFEPSLDYIVTKIPRWDMEKFKGADDRIGSSMKSVGEVMGIGRTFEESLQKAVRMLDLGLEGVTDDTLLRNGRAQSYHPTILTALKKPTTKRLFAIAASFRLGRNIRSINQMTGIDPWFLHRIKHLVEAERPLESRLTKERLKAAKQLGFSDNRIASLQKKTSTAIRSLRYKWSILPSIFQIDTLAGEFPAQTNYLYMSYTGIHHDVEPTGKKGVVILGCGPYRIGSSVEFDWTCVSTVQNLRRYGRKSIVVNCNPETVSTDHDISDRLYFEELTVERVLDIHDFEKPEGIIVSVGGQTPNNIAPVLTKKGCRIIGTHPDDIQRAEHRATFSELLDRLAISQPAWQTFSTIEAVIAFCREQGFPILCRPSYVLSGSNMTVCQSEKELRQYAKSVAHISTDYPITASRFIDDAREVELDAIAQNGRLFTAIIAEHVEDAGVHSGDATIVWPAFSISNFVQDHIRIIAANLARELRITGPFNIQFLVKERSVMIIELNLRASRTFPFLSKTTGVDLAQLTVDSLFAQEPPKSIQPPSTVSFVAVKAPQFSFARLTGADPLLHVEMGSTGEVGCFGATLEEAFLKAELAVGNRIPSKGIFISLGGSRNKAAFQPSALFLRRFPFPIFATEKTAAMLKRAGVDVQIVHKIHEHKHPNVLDLCREGNIDCVINVVDQEVQVELGDDYRIRRTAVDFNIPLYTNLQKASLFLRACATVKMKDLSIRAWDEYA